MRRSPRVDHPAHAGVGHRVRIAHLGHNDKPAGHADPARRRDHQRRTGVLALRSAARGAGASSPLMGVVLLIAVHARLPPSSDPVRRSASRRRGRDRLLAVRRSATRALPRRRGARIRGGRRRVSDLPSAGDRPAPARSCGSPERWPSVAVAVGFVGRVLAHGRAGCRGGAQPAPTRISRAVLAGRVSSSASTGVAPWVTPVDGLLPDRHRAGDPADPARGLELRIHGMVDQRAHPRPTRTCSTAASPRTG